MSSREATNDAMGAVRRLLFVFGLGRVAKLQALCFDVSDIGSLFGAPRNIRAYFEEQRKG